MPRPAPLTATEVAALKKDGVHRVDVGLYLQIRDGGAKRSWLLRYRYRGEPKNMGLGPYRLVNLTEARRAAVEAQQLLRKGIDPREARDEAKPVMTFAECAEACIKAKSPGWRNEKHAYQWRQSLETYAYPVMGKLPVDRVTANHVVKALEPIWSTKSETASRLRNRIESVLDWAESAGQRTGKNPARWRGGLEHRLPPLSRVQTIEHYVAVPYAEAPKVYAKLCAKGDVGSARALRMVMLTAMRVGSVLKATWDEFDIEARVWNIPVAHMKMKVAHRVPLSDEALRLLAEVRGDEQHPKGLVFKGQARSQPGPAKGMTDAAVRTMLRKVSPVPDADTGGLRSTFRDWCAEQTDYPREVAEVALAHLVGNEVERAYARSDLLERRAALMEEWGAFISQATQPKTSLSVSPSAD